MLRMKNDMCIFSVCQIFRFLSIRALSCLRRRTFWGCRQARLRAAPLFSFPCCAFYIAFPWCELACVGDSALVMAGIACHSIVNYNTFRFLWSCDGQTREMDLHFLFFRCDSPKQCLQATFYENRAASKNHQANFLSNKIMLQVPDQNSQILWFILCGDSRQIHCVYF